MGVFIDLDDLRWAEEPVGKDTLTHYRRVPAKPQRLMREGVFASLWQLRKN
jgi:L-alanine-DL-glutamate epimerase-like enolase superfamily enzyme